MCSWTNQALARTNSIRAVQPEEVEKVITSLSNSTSFGMDMIETFIIKLIKPDIVLALTHVINLSITITRSLLYPGRNLKSPHIIKLMIF